MISQHRHAGRQPVRRIGEGSPYSFAILVARSSQPLASTPRIQSCGRRARWSTSACFGVVLDRGRTVDAARLFGDRGGTARGVIPTTGRPFAGERMARVEMEPGRRRSGRGANQSPDGIRCSLAPKPESVSRRGAIDRCRRRRGRRRAPRRRRRAGRCWRSSPDRRWPISSGPLQPIRSPAAVKIAPPRRARTTRARPRDRSSKCPMEAKGDLPAQEHRFVEG